MQFEVSGNNENDFATHEALYSEYESLEHTLEDLRNNIHSFIISLQ